MLWVVAMGGFYGWLTISHECLSSTRPPDATFTCGMTYLVPGANWSLQSDVMAGGFPSLGLGLIHLFRHCAVVDWLDMTAGLHRVKVAVGSRLTTAARSALGLGRLDPAGSDPASVASPSLLRAGCATEARPAVSGAYC